MGRVMSDAEIRHRKKIQGKISQTTGALGLASLGAFGASKLPGAKVLTKTPRLRRLGASRAMNAINPEKAKNAALGLSTAGAGIGGAGSFNFAAYTNAESRKRQRKTPVTKGIGMEMGHFGEEGHPVELPEIIVPIEKAWEPVARNYDPEAKRHKRNKVTQAGLGVASAGALGGAGYAGAKSLKLEAKNRGKKQRRAASLPRVKAAQQVRRAAAVKHGKVAAGLAGASALTGGASLFAGRQRKDSWKTYSKRDEVSKVGDWKNLSAFGIDHSMDSEGPPGDTPNGQHRETEN